MSDKLKKMPGALRRGPGRGARTAVSATGLVESAPLRDGERLPLLVRPAVEDVDLVSWAATRGELMREKLLHHGGILFRGFGLTPGGLQDLVSAVAGEALRYDDHATPRSQLDGRLYSSTDYPADQVIEPHNECAYARSWPMKIFFLCATAPESGGATPITDCRRVLAFLDPAVRERFAERGVMYVRNFGDGLGIPWQTVFQTEDLAEVRERCRQQDITLEDKGGGRLRTRQVRPALATHPATGEEVWFNQAIAFHVSAVEEETRRLLLAERDAEDLPKHAFYGDGSPITDADLAELRRAYGEATVRFDWQEGDLLLLDNMLTAHGREPYTGPRKIVVAMAEPHAAPAAAETH